MRVEPPVKRAITFFDGQNLYHAAKDAFGYTYPNYDVPALSAAICRSRGWQLSQTRFYTGDDRRQSTEACHPHRLPPCTSRFALGDIRKGALTETTKSAE